MTLTGNRAVATDENLKLAFYSVLIGLDGIYEVCGSDLPVT
jgi:hypothetical protein